VKFVEIKGMTDQAKALNHVILTLKCKSVGIKWELFSQ